MPAPTTTNIVEIADIRNNVLLLRNGSLRMVLEVGAINFELRSEEEQNAIIQSFQDFLNSIDFPVQIIVNSQKYNIDEYLTHVRDLSGNLTNELMKIQAQEYIKFIQELATLANIMSKQFYIVVPFYLVEAGNKQGIMDSIKSIFSSSKSISAIPEEQFATYQNQLVQRAELIFDSLTGSGLRARILERDELINVFYQMHNPGSKPLVTAPQQS